VSLDKKEALARVYHGRTNDDLREGYDVWATDYDADMDGRGYRLPGFVTALLARNVALGDGPILDAGAGTGLLGEWLALAGYDDLVALDLSEAMLKVAEGRGVYRETICAPIGDALDIPDGHFRAVASAGAFGTNHAPASGFEELVRVTRPGGHLIITVRDVGFDESGFPTEIERLEGAGLWKAIETFEPFHAFPGEPDSLYHAWVFEKLI